MMKISRVDAYQGLDEVDFKVMDYEPDMLFNSDQRKGRDMTYQFYLEDEKTITLIVKWDETEVVLYRFRNKARLTEQGKKDLRQSKKDIVHQIAYYTRKVAEKGTVHPAKKQPACYTFRNERLKLYKRLMHEQIEAKGYK